MAAMDGDSLGLSGPEEQSAPGCWQLAEPQLGEGGVGLHRWGVFIKHLGAHGALTVWGFRGDQSSPALPFQQLVGGVAGR